MELALVGISQIDTHCHLFTPQNQCQNPPKAMLGIQQLHKRTNQLPDPLDQPVQSDQPPSPGLGQLGIPSARQRQAPDHNNPQPGTVPDLHDRRPDTVQKLSDQRQAIPDRLPE